MNRFVNSFEIFKNSLIRSLIFTFLMFFCLNTKSQTYIENIRAQQIDSKIILKYNLKLNKKNRGYANLERLIKTRKFEVKLLYYNIQQSKYLTINNASGKVGKYVRTGNNKKIYWDPTSNKFGTIGEIKFKIEAIPIYPKWTWGFSYNIGIINFGDFDNSSADTYSLFLYRNSRTMNINFIFPISFIDAYDKTDYEYYSNYSSTLYKKRRISNFSAITLGFGIQLNRRIFSFHVGLGPMQEKFTLEESEKSDSGSETYSNSKGSNYFLVLNGGINLRLLDFRQFTVLLPISIFVDPADADYIYLSSGLSIQF